MCSVRNTHKMAVLTHKMMFTNHCFLSFSTPKWWIVNFHFPAHIFFCWRCYFMFLVFVIIILLTSYCDIHAVNELNWAFVAKCVNVSELPTHENENTVCSYRDFSEFCFYARTLICAKMIWWETMCMIYWSCNLSEKDLLSLDPRWKNDKGPFQ